MIRRRVFNIFLLVMLSCAAISIPMVSIDANGEKVFNNELRSGDVRPVAIIGDTQRTLAFESVVLGRENNDLERKTLVSSLESEDLSAIVMLGDMVSWADQTEWRYFDSLFVGVRDRGIPVWPVVGNHDYYGLKNQALRFMHERFPMLRERTYGVQRWQDLAFVLFDSNQSSLGSSAWNEQVAWFKDALANLDEDPSVRGVIAFMHHPPYTNSTVTSDETYLQDELVPAFNASAKTMAFISGHAHGYEHFLSAGKHFIVSGGGGGPRVTHTQGESAEHTDVTPDSDPSPLHYLMMQQSARGLVFTAKGLQKRESSLSTFDQFEIDWP